MSDHESICPPPYNACPPPSLLADAMKSLERLSLPEVRRRYEYARARGDLPNIFVYARELDFRNARAHQPWLKRGHR